MSTASSGYVGNPRGKGNIRKKKTDYSGTEEIKKEVNTVHRGKEECAEALKYAKTEKDILAAQYVIELIRAVLEDRKPQEKPQQIDWNDIFRMTQKHNLQCMIYDGVVRTAGLPEQTIMEKWTKSVRLCSMQSIMQQEESVYIFGKLKQREIRVLPLKGYFMKELYPKPEYRQMGDLDILIDQDNRGKVQEAMQNMGYILEKSGSEDTVDVYQKAPWICVEVHNELLSYHHKNHNQYRNIWEKACEKNGIYQMSWDDYYIFMIEHFAKHFYISGCGIRFLLDVYIFLEKKGTDLHPEYLKEQFRVRNLEDFRQKMEKLAYQWFGKEGRIGDTEEECTILLSGVFGNLQNYYRNMQKEIYQKYKIAWLVKPIYIWKRIFVPYYEMCEKYPVLEKWPVLLPAAWMFRLFRTLLTQRKRFFREYQTIRGEK